MRHIIIYIVLVIPVIIVDSSYAGLVELGHFSSRASAYMALTAAGGPPWENTLVAGGMHRCYSGSVLAGRTYYSAYYPCDECQSADVDKDGFIDTDNGNATCVITDMCPGTKPGADVDDKGCSSEQNNPLTCIDADDDGIYESGDDGCIPMGDKCPGSRSGVNVNCDGCSVYQLTTEDPDDDGWPNWIDNEDEKSNSQKWKVQRCQLNRDTGNYTWVQLRDEDGHVIEVGNHDDTKDDVINLGSKYKDNYSDLLDEIGPEIDLPNKPLNQGQDPGPGVPFGGDSAPGPTIGNTPGIDDQGFDEDLIKPDESSTQTDKLLAQNNSLLDAVRQNTQDTENALDAMHKDQNKIGGVLHEDLQDLKNAVEGIDGSGGSFTDEDDTDEDAIVSGNDEMARGRQDEIDEANAEEWEQEQNKWSDENTLGEYEKYTGEFTEDEEKFVKDEKSKLDDSPWFNWLTNNHPVMVALKGTKIKTTNSRCSQTYEIFGGSFTLSLCELQEPIHEIGQMMVSLTMLATLILVVWRKN